MAVVLLHIGRRWTRTDGVTIAVIHPRARDRMTSGNQFERKRVAVITTKGSTVIGAGIEVVFDFLADARNESQWLPGASDVRLTTEEPVQQGSRFVGSYARAGQVTVEVTRYDRPTRLTLSGTAKILTFADDIELLARSDGTALLATITTRPKGVMRLMSPLMGRVIQKQFQSNWEHLRVHLEANHE